MSHPRAAGEPRIIVALDFPQPEAALGCVGRLDPNLCRLKVGKELFVHAGPDFVRSLIERGFDVFLDLKFHDIPNTVAAACRAAADLGVWMINVHAGGGRTMLEAARTALDSGTQRPWLVAVTVLTSLTQAELTEVGLDTTPQDQVLRLARLSRDCGLDGVVCSAREAAVLRQTLGADFLLVTPGIRPSGSAQDDQRRIMTPQAARQAGADYLVVGRPVTQARDPQQALLMICNKIA